MGCHLQQIGDLFIIEIPDKPQINGFPLPAGKAVKVFFDTFFFLTRSSSLISSSRIVT
jgi:hypothetical protein